MTFGMRNAFRVQDIQLTLSYVFLWESGVSTKFAGSSCNDVICVDGSSVISGHFDKKIRFWDARTDTPTQDVVLPGRITSLDLSGDKNFLLASVRDDSLAILDLRMNIIIAQFT